MTATNIMVLILLIASLILNWAMVFRISCADAEFYLDKSDPDNIKPVIRFDLDDIEDKPFFIVKVLKDKKGKNNE